jgi:hypothetical protein
MTLQNRLEAFDATLDGAIGATHGGRHEMWRTHQHAFNKCLAAQMKFLLGNRLLRCRDIRERSIFRRWLHSKTSAATFRQRSNKPGQSRGN